MRDFKHTLGRRSWSFLAAGALLVAAGCNQSPYHLAPVHGTVTVDDKPLFQGKVMFTPVAKGENKRPGRHAIGTIDSEGRFRLTTKDPDDGALVGDHWAIVINTEEEVPKGVPEFARLTLPNRVTVEPDKDNQIDLMFTRDQVRKYREDDR